MSNNIPSEFRYSKSHEWIKLNDDGTVVIGVTEHAQEALGDLVYIDLPELETEIRTGEEFGVIESVKAASDLFAPINGEVVAVNEDVQTDPSLINKDPYGGGWILQVKIDDENELSQLMEADDYAEFLANEE